MILMEDILMEYILIKDIWKNKFIFLQKYEKYKKFFQGFHFPKYKNRFLLRKHKFFRVSISWNIRNFCRREYFIFLAWGEKCRVSFEKT